MQVSNLIPNENDILLGRGGINHTHSGNTNLRNFAGALAEHYHKAGKKLKTDMSRELVKLVHDQWPSGRFIKRNKHVDRWEVVSDEIARNKASQALRDAVTELLEKTGRADEPGTDGDDTAVNPKDVEDILNKFRQSFRKNCSDKPQVQENTSYNSNSHRYDNNLAVADHMMSIQDLISQHHDVINSAGNEDVRFNSNQQHNMRPHGNHGSMPSPNFSAPKAQEVTSNTFGKNDQVIPSNYQYYYLKGMKSKAAASDTDSDVDIDMSSLNMGEDKDGDMMNASHYRYVQKPSITKSHYDNVCLPTTTFSSSKSHYGNVSLPNTTSFSNERSHYGNVSFPSTFDRNDQRSEMRNFLGNQISSSTHGTLPQVHVRQTLRENLQQQYQNNNSFQQSDQFKQMMAFNSNKLNTRKLGTCMEERSDQEDEYPAHDFSATSYQLQQQPDELKNLSCFSASHQKMFAKMNVAKTNNGYNGFPQGHGHDGNPLDKVDKASSRYSFTMETFSIVSSNHGADDTISMGSHHPGDFEGVFDNHHQT